MRYSNIHRSCVLLLFSALAAMGCTGSAIQAAETLRYFGYDDCLLLQNQTTRVVLCPAAGGRVLEYSLNGKNALYLDEAEKGFVFDPTQKQGGLSAGRFDIGPEKLIPPRPQLWLGRWAGESTGSRSARMTSLADRSTGVQLIRQFELAAEGSQLKCTQFIKNISDQRTQWCHWSRTFALGNGICVIPLSETSRFPNHYVMYESGRLLDFQPEDPAIRRRGNYLVISDVPRKPKLGMDSMRGWFSYLMKNDLMFVKRYPTYADRVYNEVASLSISIWYPESRMVELEPIGPREILEPGETSSFTEAWELVPFDFPDDRASLDLEAVRRLSKQ